MNAFNTLWAPVLWGQAQTDALRRVEAVVEAAREFDTILRDDEYVFGIGASEKRKALAAALAALDEGGET